MRAIGFKDGVNEWRLFIDGSNAVLLHNGNEKLSIPVAHVVGWKETYGNCKLILQAINYNKYGWKVCADLKVVAILVGLQAGCGIAEQPDSILS